MKPNYLKKSIGRELRRIRLEHDYIQKTVSDYLGVGRSVYTAKEIGMAFPTVDQLLKLATLYKCNLMDFVAFHPSSIEHQKMIDELKEENKRLKERIAMLEEDLEIDAC